MNSWETFSGPKWCYLSPDNGKLYSHSTQGHSHKVPLKCFISQLEDRAKKGGSVRVLYLTLGGGMGDTKDKKNTRENWRDRRLRGDVDILPRRGESDGGKMKGEK